MNIYLTLDYEIYFGEKHGTVEKCIIEPTNKLREISKRTGAYMTYFIDIGHVIALEKFKSKFPKLEIDLNLITENINLLVAEGNDCQLHIHPHWETSFYNGEKWIFDYNKYKLVDFNDSEIKSIFERYKERLGVITQKPVNSFRAGGWCLQPFNRIKASFLENEIKIDSTVFPKGKSNSQYYYYDFTKSPNKSEWRFSDELCKEDQNGDFLELPISSYKYSPVFFWKLHILGNLFPKNHKPIGDGKPMPTKGHRKRMLTKRNILSANLEGLFVNKIETIVKTNQKNKFNSTVVIGHPKALTNYSIDRLEKVINTIKKEHTFSVFSDIKL